MRAGDRNRQPTLPDAIQRRAEMRIKPCHLPIGFICLVAGACLIFLTPLAGLAQSFDFRAAFPDLPGSSDPSPVASKGFSVQGPGIVVVWTWNIPYLEVNTTYNSGGVFFRGRSSDSPFERSLCSKLYQDGREVPGTNLVVGKDLLRVWVAELGNKTYTNTWEVHPSVYPPGTNIDSLCAYKPPPPDNGSDSKPKPKPVPSMDDTSWIVNGHPVPWDFSSGGRVESKGLWTGTWIETSDGIQVTITVQGIKDTFIIKLSSDGRTFTAYKDGQAYRTGVQVKARQLHHSPWSYFLGAVPNVRPLSSAFRCLRTQTACSSPSSG
jgi:hypothetical protein